MSAAFTAIYDATRDGVTATITHDETLRFYQLQAANAGATAILTRGFWDRSSAFEAVDETIDMVFALEAINDGEAPV